MLNRRTTISKQTRENQDNISQTRLLSMNRNNQSSPTSFNKNIDAILFAKQQQQQKSQLTDTRTFLVSAKRKYHNHHHHRHQQFNSTTHKQLLSLRGQADYCKNLIVNPIKSSSINKNKLIPTIRQGSPKEAYKMISNMEKKQHIYYLATILLVLCALSSTAVQFATADGYALAALLQKMRISPDIIKVPNYLNVIKVELNNNIVKPGDPVPAKNFKDLNMARISWEVSSDEARHTLMLLDLDRKPNSTQNIYNQYTSLNIPGHIINGGQTIVAFDPPAVPCNPTTKHRILMLAFHQEQNIDLVDVTYMAASSGHSSKRENFKLADFIKNHRLDLVAANVFQAIGETNGICSGAASIHSALQVGLSILIAMVITVSLSAFSERRTLI